ncbi:MAG: C25 family cysteine peptidase [Candidatus Zixiibacteriota bacterium]
MIRLITEWNGGPPVSIKTCSKKGAITRRGLTCFLLLLAALFRVSGSAQAPVKHHASFSEADLIFDRKNGFDVVSLGGCVRTHPPGHPDLPSRIIHLILPGDARVTDVSVSDAREVILDGEFLVAPAQPDRKTDGSNLTELVRPNRVIYDSDSLYPPEPVEILDQGYMSGSHLVALVLHPLQCQPRSRKLLFYTQLEISVELYESREVPITSGTQRRSDRVQRLHEEILARFADNKKDVPGFICRNLDPVLFKGEAGASTYPEYLVVTSGELQSAFLPLVEWKTKKGTLAGIVRIDSILSVYSGRDDAEKLRNFLIEAYQNGTSWVLLGGDEDVVPIRYAYPYRYGTPVDPTYQQICDLYFSDVDGQWDRDNDGIWGQPEHDRPDIYPDLFVGRVPCGDSAEAQAFVEKLLCYEKKPGAGAIDYLTRALWICSDYMRDLDQHSELARWVPSHFHQDLTTLIESPAGDAPNPASPDGATCIQVMDQGWGIIGVLAHGKSSAFVAKSHLDNGNPKSWVTTFPGQNDGHGHLPNLNNESRYGIMYSIACSQSAIDVDKYPDLGGDPCVGEFYPLASRKAGVAFLGYSRAGSVFGSYNLFVSFLTNIFDHRLRHHLGVAEALSRCADPSRRSLNYGHNLFGDPEMPVWTENPSVLVVTHPEEVPQGRPTLDFFVSSQGNGIGQALVCLSLGDKIVFAGETGQDGYLSCELNLDDVGEMSVVATKPNFVPYEHFITVVEGEATPGIESFQLLQNFPNPFNTATIIQFSVGGEQNPIHTKMQIYNLLGQKVRTLVDEPKNVGDHKVIWDGRDDFGKDVASGVYIYRMRAGAFTEARKLVLLK